MEHVTSKTNCPTINTKEVLQAETKKQWTILEAMRINNRG